MLSIDNKIQCTEYNGLSFIDDMKYDKKYNKKYNRL